MQQKAPPKPPDKGKPKAQQVHQKQQTKLPPETGKQPMNNDSTTATALSTIQPEDIAKAVNTIANNTWN